MKRPVPDSVRVGGREWTIERVWPARVGDSRVPLEARTAGVVRGGYAEPDGRIALLAPDEDTRLPALGAVGRAGRLVAHRPGRRAVVRLAADRGYAKVVASGKAPRIVDAHDRGRAFSAGFRIPPALAHEFDPSAVTRFGALNGRSFGELGGDGTVTDAAWERIWDEWADGWLAAMSSAPADDLPVHDAHDEAAIVRTWAAHATPLLGGDVARTAERVVARLEVAGAASTLSHRDLHDGQLLWHPEEGIGLIDLDTCARADPGLDLGNLAAHADFAARQGRWPTKRAGIAVAAVATAAAALGVDAERLAAWRSAARLRIACVNVLRPRWRAAARAEWASVDEEARRR